MFRKIPSDQGAARAITVTIDGQVIVAQDGEPVAAILLRSPPFTSRRTPVSGALRAPYCMMGACFECLVEVDGETSTRSCLVFATDGMVIRRQLERPDALADHAA